MDNQDWQPSTDTTMLKARAALLRKIRQFFLDREVLEVETPILSTASGTDPALDSLVTSVQGQGSKSKPCFLQTSPEFAMKRLLANGSGAIYQLAKVFRNNESGKKHNPEFTMLEWYRPGFSLSMLMDEVEALVSQVLDMSEVARIPYRELFLQHLEIDPFTASVESLQQLAAEKVALNLDSDDADLWLDLLFSHCIEPELHDPVFITDYPASQAALARIETNDQGERIASRFELVARGMELANGYHELTDAREQRERFEQDQLTREKAGLPLLPLDENLIAALEFGLPDCSGVALGVDRLLMLDTGCDHISDVISFTLDKA